MSELPTGTVTFLFTDIEGSTRLWEQDPDAMKTVLARHDELLRDAVQEHGGHVVKRMGDGLHAVFAVATDAVEAALSGQRAVTTEQWDLATPLRVRMALHTGAAAFRDGDYYGSSVNRAARLAGIAHGGQVVISLATEELVRDSVGDDMVLQDLGEHRLRDLARLERVFQVASPGEASKFPPLRSLDVRLGNVPRHITTFVGREHEIANVAELVRERSLVTLTGVGGVGKTRLATEVAAATAAEFPDGAWVCELASVSDPSAVWEAVATALGAQQVAGRTLADVLVEHLGTRRLLLVLDNCEHLLSAAASVAETVAQQCPRVAVLATSREGLAVAGERIVAVPSLGLPDSDTERDGLERTEAVRLFVDRAIDANSDFAITDDNATAIAQLCRHLDGIPLAIELAAARVRSLPPEELVTRLDQRFRLLARGRRVGSTDIRRCGAPSTGRMSC